ncbi:MAG TPA: Ig-like domain-containing protein, partial [Bacillota bacterium]|nr:Ig-like domain-containing protein [Bacillota bacterium]
DGVTVILEVNNLINGYDKYDIIVDGVEDLAGNELYYKMDLDTATEQWDKTAPKLEEADAVSSKVVALTFDERVEYEDGAKLVLAKGSETAATASVKLDAKGYAENNTVVEFSSETPLVDGENYTVVGIVYGGSDTDGGIKDLKGNRVLKESIKFGDFTFEGIDDALDLTEVDTYEQVNGKTFEVTMSKDVKFKTGVTVTGGKADIGDFTASIKDNVITLVIEDGKIEEDAEYDINFASFFTDVHGNAVENADDDDSTILIGEYTDTDAPEIESVVAINRETIEITFSEDIEVMNDSAKTAFISGLNLKNYDLDSNISLSLEADNLSDNDGDNVIRVKVGKPMEARYEYELTVAAGAFKDFVGIANEDEDIFYFDGTNLAK